MPNKPRSIPPILDLEEALGLLHEAEAHINILAGDWGHGAGREGSLVDRMRDYLVNHGWVPGKPRPARRMPQ